MTTTPQTTIPTSNQDGRKLAFTVYDNSKNPTPQKAATGIWGKLVKLLSLRAIRDEKDGLAFSFVKLKPGTARGSANVEALFAVVLDIDDGTPLDALSEGISHLEYFAYSTHSHTEAHPKCRLIFPLARDVSPAEWPTVWQHANQLIGQHADPAAKDVARLFYFPSCPAERQNDAFFDHHPGPWFDPDSILKPPPVANTALATPADVNAELWGALPERPDPNRVCEDGERTHHLTRLAGMWIGQDRPLDEVIRLARGWNSRNDPPLPDEKVIVTCDSLYRTHQRNHPEQEALVPAAGTACVPLFDLETARVIRLLREPPPKRRWLLNDCLPYGKVGGIVAPGGTGKSQFVLQLAISAASGIPLAKAWEVGETGGVLALFAEDDTDEIHRRLHRTMETLRQYSRMPTLHDVLEKNLFLRSMVSENNLMTATAANGDLYRTDYAARLVATARNIENLKLIIIDPASRFRGGHENAAEDATRFVEALEYLSKETGATVLVLHHTNKGSAYTSEPTQAASRGSSAFSDGIRWQMNLSRGVQGRS